MFFRFNFIREPTVLENFVFNCASGATRPPPFLYTLPIEYAFGAYDAEFLKNRMRKSPVLML